MSEYNIRIITSAALLLILLICLGVSVSCQTQRSGTAQLSEMGMTEENQQRLLKAVPPPKLNESLERHNLKKRLIRFNDPNKVSYIYLVNYGKVMAFYTIKGKVSSVNSLLTTPDQVIRGCQCERVVVASPDLDGSYGSNGDAVFFFTTDDIYVEWAGDYMLVDQPLKLSTPPELVRVIKDKEEK